MFDFNAVNFTKEVIILLKTEKSHQLFWGYRKPIRLIPQSKSDDNRIEKTAFCESSCTC